MKTQAATKGTHTLRLPVKEQLCSPLPLSLSLFLLTRDAGREDSWCEGGWSEESFLTVLLPSVSMACGWAAWAACRDCILAVSARWVAKEARGMAWRAGERRMHTASM